MGSTQPSKMGQKGEIQAVQSQRSLRKLHLLVGCLLELSSYFIRNRGY